jgi:D-amino-acid dehydrogenase
MNASASAGSGGTAPKDVVVIGAGVVGVCTALFLQRDGHRVTVVDPKAPGTATSFGNAGSIAIGSVYPVGTPGNWRQVPGMIMDPASPLNIRWSYLPRMVPWLLRFLEASRPSRVEAISHALRALSKDAMNAHNVLLRGHRIDGIVTPVGWLKVYSSQASFDRTLEERTIMLARGVNGQVLDADEIRQLEPGLAPHFTHGWFQPDNGFVTSPLKLTEAYAEAFRGLGGRFVQERAVRFEFGDSGPTRLVTDLGMHAADAFVVCAGAWSNRVTELLGTKVPLDTERGYHLNLSVDSGPGLRRPTVIGDHGFVLAPMQDGLRLTTGSEFAGVDGEPDFRKIRRMVPLAQKALPGLSGDVTREWLGFRPALPDSMPVIGRSGRFGNVYFGFGHSHIGLTLSARTGQIIADLMAGRDPGVDLKPYRAERF